MWSVDKRSRGIVFGAVLFALVAGAAVFVVPALREARLPSLHRLASRPVPDAAQPSPVSAPSPFAAELMWGEVSSTPESQR